MMNLRYVAILGVSVAVLGFSAGAHAQSVSIAAQIEQAVAAGNWAAVESFQGSEDAAVQEQVAMTLLQMAADNATSNPDLAAQALSAAAPFTANLGGEAAVNAAAAVQTIVSTVSASSVDPNAASGILNNAVSIASQPSISSAAPQLASAASSALATVVAQVQAAAGGNQGNQGGEGDQGNQGNQGQQGDNQGGQQGGQQQFSSGRPDNNPPPAGRSSDD